MARVGEGMRKAVRDLQGKPIVAVLQSFYPKGRRMPNRAEFRCMAYLSVVSGATGIMWFSYDYNGKMAEEHPEAWHALQELAGEFKQLGPVFLSFDSHGQMQRRQVRVGNDLRAAAWQQGNFRWALAELVGGPVARLQRQGAARRIASRRRSQIPPLRLG